MRNVIAAVLLLIPTSAMAAIYVHVAPVFHVAPVHVAPVVRVAPVIRTPTVKPGTIGRPVSHTHHPRIQPVVVSTTSPQPKCVEPKAGSKECAKK
jgi:hypothetical protein